MPTSHDNLSRRNLLQNAAAAVAVAGMGGAAAGSAVAADAASASRAVKHGKIKQSVVPWCFKDHWKPEQLIDISHKLGLVSVELIDPRYWPLLKEHGMTCAIAGSHGFPRGWSNPKQWDECTEVLTKRIDECVEFGVKRVITFTGMQADGISVDQGYANTVEGLKKMAPYAEKKGVTLCMEHLNTRDDSHPMKGHPGYLGDDIDRCMDVVRKVNSPNVKVLFDIYHVQIMNGDVIRRIRQYKDEIGHVHTAGNPGRAELDDTQEINYPPIMRALLEVGYDGYVGQEFIPTRDPLAGLAEAVKLCDVTG